MLCFGKDSVVSKRALTGFSEVKKVLEANDIECAGADA